MPSASLQDYYRGSLRRHHRRLAALRVRLHADTATDDTAADDTVDATADEIVHIAHRLRGTGASYGFAAVSDSAAALDELARDRARPLDRRLAQRFDARLEALLAAIADAADLDHEPTGATP